MSAKSTNGKGPKVDKAAVDAIRAKGKGHKRSTRRSGSSAPNPFKWQGKTYASVPELARENPKGLLALDAAGVEGLQKANKGMSAGSAGARLAHVSRILDAAGI